MPGAQVVVSASLLGTFVQLVKPSEFDFSEYRYRYSLIKSSSGSSQVKVTVPPLPSLTPVTVAFRLDIREGVLAAVVGVAEG